MKLFLYVVLQYCASMMFFLLVQKPVFFLYNRATCNVRVGMKDMWHFYRHGFRTDMISSAYLTVLPFLASWIYANVRCFNIVDVLLIICLLLSVSVALIVVSDTALYKFWRYKLDSSVFRYLRSLKGAFASVSAAYIAVAIIAVITMAAIYFFITYSAVRLVWFSSTVESMTIAGFVVCNLTAVMCLGVFFLIVRGTGIRPNNPSIAYFSRIPFLNHSAVNPMYNLVYSLSEKDDYGSQFQSMPKEECEVKFQQLYPTHGKPKVRLLNTDRPNILLVVWESLSARFVGSLGGDGNVCRNIDRLSKEGVLFTHCDAGSFRTDRGLVCLLSGVLGQPTMSVINYARKLPQLPGLPRRLRKEDYETMAVHGGDLSIMHKGEYYLASGHSKLISQKDMPASAPKCKWGVQDSYMFDWLLDDIIEKSEKDTHWFTTFQTLSSHEPFDVPYHLLANPVDNAFAFTDECFGRFIDKLKASPAWDNLLVICVGDHGFNESSVPQSRSDYEHIPLLLLGGAVAKPMTIHTPIGQTDLAATLLGQMGLPHDDFIFSRDILADTYAAPFTFHSYNNGFAVRDERGYTDYDNVAQAAVSGDDPERIEMGKVILQKLYSYLDKL